MCSHFFRLFFVLCIVPKIRAYCGKNLSEKGASPLERTMWAVYQALFKWAYYAELETKSTVDYPQG